MIVPMQDHAYHVSKWCGEMCWVGGGGHTCIICIVHTCDLGMDYVCVDGFVDYGFRVWGAGRGGACHSKLFFALEREGPKHGQ